MKKKGPLPDLRNFAEEIDMPYKGLNRLPVLVKEILNMVQVKQ